MEIRHSWAKLETGSLPRAQRASEHRGSRRRLSTTQAVYVIRDDSIRGYTSFPSNHFLELYKYFDRRVYICRIEEKYHAFLAPEAAKFNLSVLGFDHDSPAGTTRYLQLSTEGETKRPRLRLLKEVFGRFSRGHRFDKGDIRAIFRLCAIREADRAHTHTVDERVHVREERVPDVCCILEMAICTRLVGIMRSSRMRTRFESNEHIFWFSDEEGRSTFETGFATLSRRGFTRKIGNETRPSTNTVFASTSKGKEFKREEAGKSNYVVLDLYLNYT
ncbi:hypothetical protein C8R43DRAFT_942609 [Mycena crocata]|nr:hypothetical protein C8R43DRAFT_942609 [Mycena crocata]